MTSNRTKLEINRLAFLVVGSALTLLGGYLGASGYLGAKEARASGSVAATSSLAPTGKPGAYEARFPTLSLPPGTHHVGVDLLYSYSVGKGTYVATAKVESGGATLWSGKQEWYRKRSGGYAPTAGLRIGKGAVAAKDVSVLVTLTTPGDASIESSTVRILANPSDHVEIDEQSDMTFGAILALFGLASLGGAIGLHRAIKKDDEARAAQGFG